MKKLFFLIQLTTAIIMYSALTYAHDDDYRWRGHGHGHHGHHRENYYPQPQVNYYYSVPRAHQYPQPQVQYYPQPQPEYYPQQPQRQRYQDPRSTQGLAGGVIGSVFGYQMGSGDPVVTGLGAAAGSYLGNGMAGRW